MPALPEIAAATDPSDATLLQRRYVRVVQRNPNGLVAFEFAIGWPDLAQELVLPLTEFEAFCQKSNVIHLPDGPRGSSEFQPELTP